MARLSCRDETRRDEARRKGLNGIDSITVSADQLRLSVILFGRAPADLAAANFRIDGGTQITAIAVVDARSCPDTDEDYPDCVQLTVDRAGDHSCYSLGVVALDAFGRPGTEPYPGFDIRYYCSDFSFKQNCPASGDCAPAHPANTPVDDAPVIDYLARDYASLRQGMLDRLSLTVPDWSERHLPDVGVTLVELLAYAGDLLNYRLDAVGTEAYLDTARLRTSVRRHARLVDYRMHDGCAARSYLTLTVSGDIELPAGDFRFSAGAAVFEPVVDEPVALSAAHNQIALWTWGDGECCLPVGATSATLVDEELTLAAGDLLLLEEMVGATTGLPADADHSHRQVVRLTAIRAKVDPLYEQALLQVEWDRMDALTFPLCISSRGGPDCVDFVVGVARGNMVLVEHGASLDWCGAPAELPTWPPEPPTTTACPDSCAWGCPPGGAVPVPTGYPPHRRRPTVRLTQPGVTQHIPFPGRKTTSRSQADALARIPATARARVTAMLTAEAVTADDTAYLTVLFGAASLKQLKLATDPINALRHLSARFDALLVDRLERLQYLCRRARAGYVLTRGDEGRELDWEWGAGAGATIDPLAPAARGPAGAALNADPRRALPAVRVSVAADEWLPRRDVLRCGPTDRYVVGETDDDGYLSLRFGDGITGAVPAFGAVVEVRYRVGNGTAGNVGAEAIDTIAFCETHQEVVTAVRNPLPATGGVDPEPVAVVRQRAPRAFGTRLRRAITPADYAEVAGRARGVQRAGAQLRWTGSWYEAEVAVDALGTDTAPGWLLVDELDRLERVRRIGHDVRVASAVMVPLELGLCVQVRPGYLTAHVGAAVRERLGSAHLPDGSLAFFHPDNLTFATSVRVSAIVAAVAAIPGVAGASVTVLKRQFAQDEGAVAAGVLSLAADEVAQLDNDSARPDNGLLTLTIGGGR